MNQHPAEAAEASPIQGRRIAFNSAINLITGLAILGLNLLFLPLLIRAFGSELFGVLSVTWMVLANLAWLDLGFSRAAARFVSQELAAGKLDRAAMWSWTATLTQVVIGGCGALLVYLFAPKLVGLLHIVPARRAIVTVALRLFAFAIPLDLAARSLSGVLQAAQRFGLLNALNLVSTAWTFAVYGIGIARGGDFGVLIYGLFALRVFNLLANFIGAAALLPGLRRPPDLKGFFGGYRANAYVMVSFGWWISLASLLGALLLYFDQWLISFLIGVSLLPFYSVPLNVLSRLAIFPSSITATLFPAFSALHAQDKWDRIEDFFVRSHVYVLAMLLPIGFVVFVWGGEAMRLWMGADFAAQATQPLRVLVIGFSVALLAPISGALLEAIGQPRILTLIYAGELPFNFAVVYVLTEHFGIIGAAWSFTIRAFVETVALWTLTYRRVPFTAARITGSPIPRLLAMLICLGAVAALLPAVRVTSPAAIGITAAVLLAYGVAVLAFVLSAEDRRNLLRLRAPRIES